MTTPPGTTRRRARKKDTPASHRANAARQSGSCVCPAVNQRSRNQSVPTQLLPPAGKRGGTGVHYDPIICRKLCASKEAPPTRRPSTLSSPTRAEALAGLTLPPYRMGSGFRRASPGSGARQARSRLVPPVHIRRAGHGRRSGTVRSVPPVRKGFERGALTIGAVERRSGNDGT